MDHYSAPNPTPQQPTNAGKLRFLRLPLALFCAVLMMIVLTFQPDRRVTAAGDWWDNGWDFRVPVTVDADGTARTDKPAEVAINFTNLFSSLV